MFSTAVLRALLIALALLGLFAHSGHSEALSGHKSASVDYRGDLNRWVVRGHISPVDCPEEDSCDVRYLGAAVIVFKTP